MNWPTIPEHARVLVQGITGKEGLRMSAWMLEGGMDVVGGVNPKKAGETVHGKPVFATVADALARHPDVFATSIVVPAPFVYSAAEEALRAGVRFIHILTEHVPVHDVRRLRALAGETDAVILGPSSVGALAFQSFRIGYLGGRRPFERLREGGLALLSSSGGMTNEILMAFARSGIGIRLALHLGGDRVSGFGMSEAAGALAALSNVRAIAAFVEPGAPFLRDLQNGSIPDRPIVLLLPGDAIESMPRGLPFGHAGTIIGEDDPPLAEVRARLNERGVRCVETMDAFIAVCSTL